MNINLIDISNLPFNWVSGVLLVSLVISLVVGINIQEKVNGSVNNVNGKISYVRPDSSNSTSENLVDYLSEIPKF